VEIKQLRGKMGSPLKNGFHFKRRGAMKEENSTSDPSPHA